MSITAANELIEAAPTTSEKTASHRDPMIYIGWAAMVVGMFMAILDIQIVASSLSEIQAGLSASPDEIAWVQTSYLIAEVIMIPLSGYLARMWGTRRLFLISAIGFTLSSVACAYAWSLESLIALRALQGFIGGGMIPCVFASLYLVFPPSKQGIANVVVGMIVTCAPALGPTLGGFITETLSWQWLFLINLVPGLLVILIVSAMPEIDRADSSLAKGFDLFGLAMMALFLGGLEFVLDEGPRNDWFDDHHISTWAIIATITGALFFWRTLTYQQPIVDLRILRNRNFTIGCLMAAVLGMGLYGGVYVTPLFLARVQGLNAYQIGTVMSVMGLFMFFTAPIAGRLIEALNARAVLAIGMVLAAIGLYTNGQLTAESSYADLFWPQALRGMGFVSMIISINPIAMATLPKTALNNAAGIYNLARNLGGAFALAGANTLMESRFDLHYARIADWINPGRPEFQQFIDNSGIALGGEQAALEMAQGLVSREALMMTFNDIHLVMAGFFVFTFFLLPLVSSPKEINTGGH